jgi:hypothetical protein
MPLSGLQLMIRVLFLSLNSIHFHREDENVKAFGGKTAF